MTAEHQNSTTEEIYPPGQMLIAGLRQNMRDIEQARLQHDEVPAPLMVESSVSDGLLEHVDDIDVLRLLQQTQRSTDASMVQSQNVAIYGEHKDILRGVQQVDDAEILVVTYSVAIDLIELNSQQHTALYHLVNNMLQTRRDENVVLSEQEREAKIQQREQYRKAIAALDAELGDD